jgi:hypothetical protein
MLDANLDPAGWMPVPLNHKPLEAKGRETPVRETALSGPFFVGICIHVYIFRSMIRPNATQILQQIAQIQHMEPGKLCVIGQGPNSPYYNLQCREGGKTVTRYVPADQADLVAEHTANYQQFQALVGQYAQLIIKQTRAERTAGFKKKTSRLRSSWPKTRKSSS